MIPPAAKRFEHIIGDRVIARRLVQLIALLAIVVPASILFGAMSWASWLVFIGAGSLGGSLSFILGFRTGYGHGHRQGQRDSGWLTVRAHQAKRVN